MGEKISNLLQAAFLNDDALWFHNLGVMDPTDQQLELFDSVIQAVNAIFEGTQSVDEGDADISTELLEELARILLSSAELKEEFSA